MNIRQEFDSGRSDFVPPAHKYIEHEHQNSAFFLDHGEEQYAIQRAFTANNFTYLRQIPDKLQHGVILRERALKVKGEVCQQAELRSKTVIEREEIRNSQMQQHRLQKIGNLGYFEVFPYEQSQYSRQREIAQLEKIQSKEKRRNISDLEFRPAGFEKKLKSEDPFEYVDKITWRNQEDKKQYIFPFHLPEDTYDRFHQSQLRQRIIQETSKIAGDFLPSQNQKTLTKVVKSKLPIILNSIQHYLKKYLKQIGFYIGVNKRDHIEVLFEEKHENNKKMQVLMSKLCDNETLIEYLLKRNKEKWSQLNPETKFLQFSFLPPWVKQPEESLNRN